MNGDRVTRRRLAQREWAKRNPFYARCVHANNKAAALGIEGRLTPDAVAARFAFCGYRCWICGGGDATTIDHVIPLFRGGLNLASNIRPAHDACNKRRGANDWWEAERAARSHCKNGHPWIPENLVMHATSGAPTCVVCRRERALRYWRKKAAS